MKLLYAPAILSLAVLLSLGTQSLASAGQAKSVVTSDGEEPDITLQAEPLFGILSGMAAVEPGEEPSLAEAPEVEVNPDKLQGNDPRGWHGYYCPPCGRG